MAKKRIAINGFGRIGRLTFRNLMKNKPLNIHCQCSLFFYKHT